MKSGYEMKIEGIKGGHVQGIATDKNREFLYFSFTTCLVKTDINGNVIGSVTGLAGHLGCIAYNYDDGKVYGSLEYKHDAIGKGILKGRNEDVEDGFYIAVFDVDKINRLNMDAQTDGVMKAVFLKEVLDDYFAPNHKFGCSGIDGVTFAPIAGENDGKKYLYVAYGIYSDTSRDDNDDQVILRYDISAWDKYLFPLDQRSMHRYGPASPDSKYFLYTGNTTYGVQNLEYDAYSNMIVAAVYRGKKEKYPNYPTFFVDMSKKAYFDEDGKERLSLAQIGICHEPSGIYGSEFGLGATGMISLGDGEFLFSNSYSNAEGNCSRVELYIFNKDSGEFNRK